jgi:hypothetical protein
VDTVMLLAEETISTYLQRVSEKAGLSPAKIQVLLAARNVRRTVNALRDNITGKRTPNPATIRALADLPALQRVGFSYDYAMRLAGHLSGAEAGRGQEAAPLDLPADVRELLALHQQMTPYDKRLWVAIGNDFIRHPHRDLEQDDRGDEGQAVS